jgi:hypothetical protein
VRDGQPRRIKSNATEARAIAKQASSQPESVGIGDVGPAGPPPPIGVRVAVGAGPVVVGVVAAEGVSVGVAVNPGRPEGVTLGVAVRVGVPVGALVGVLVGVAVVVFVAV